MCDRAGQSRRLVWNRRRWRVGVYVSGLGAQAVVVDGLDAVDVRRFRFDVAIQIRGGSGAGVVLNGVEHAGIVGCPVAPQYPVAGDRVVVRVVPAEGHNVVGNRRSGQSGGGRGRLVILGQRWQTDVEGQGQRNPSQGHRGDGGEQHEESPSSGAGRHGSSPCSCGSPGRGKWVVERPARTLRASGVRSEGAEMRWCRASAAPAAGSAPVPRRSRPGVTSGGAKLGEGEELLRSKTDRDTVFTAAGSAGTPLNSLVNCGLSEGIRK